MATLTSSPLLSRGFAFSWLAERGVAVRVVLLHPLPAAPPRAIGGAHSLQARSLGSIAQSHGGQLLRCQSLQRDQLRRACDRWHDKAGEVVDHRPRDQFAQRSSITAIGLGERFEVALPLALLDDRGWVAEANQKQVHEQASNPAVAVDEGMDALEGGMPRSDRLADWRLIARQ